MVKLVLVCLLQISELNFSTIPRQPLDELGELLRNLLGDQYWRTEIWCWLYWLLDVVMWCVYLCVYLFRSWEESLVIGSLRLRLEAMTDRFFRWSLVICSLHSRSLVLAGRAFIFCLDTKNETKKVKPNYSLAHWPSWTPKAFGVAGPRTFLLYKNWG